MFGVSCRMQPTFAANLATVFTVPAVMLPTVFKVLK